MPPKKTTAPVKKAATTGSKSTSKPAAKGSTTTKTAAKKEEPKKEEPAAATNKTPNQSEPQSVAVKAIKLQLVEDASETIRKSGRAAFVSDNEGGVCATFMKYSGVAIQFAEDLFKPGKEENIRQAVIAAVRQNKPLVVVLNPEYKPKEEDKDKEQDVAQLEELSACFDKVKSGLMVKLRDRSIRQAIQGDWYDDLVKSTDDKDIYGQHYFIDEKTEKFFFVIISNNPTPGKYIQDNYWLVKIED